jgi:hypothetical protein
MLLYGVPSTVPSWLPPLVQCLAGPSGITPSSTPVNIRLPHVSSGTKSGDGAGIDHAAVIDAFASSDDEWGMSETDAASEQTHVSPAESAAEQAGLAQPYAEVDSSSAPVPLEGPLLTLSGQGSAKWDSLVHLEAIKVWPCSFGVGPG